MTENEVLKDLKNYQGILKAKTRINAGVNPEIALDAITQAIEIIQQYKAIGTVEEFKALKEKSVAKKPLNDGMQRPFSYYCPNCKEELSDDGYKPDEEYCVNCGQHILVEN